jgi:hypothetical protein
MDNNFTKAMQFVGQWEWGNRPDGGYTNDPVDPGGETKWGISKRYDPNLDIKNLTLDEAMKIYWKDYWLKAKCDEKDLALAVATFDSAVNCGVSRATEWAADGSFDSVINKRRNYYTSLVTRKPALNKYFKGWIRRCVDLQKYCEILSHPD